MVGGVPDQNEIFVGMKILDMKKKLSHPVCVLIVVLILTGCKKDSGPGSLLTGEVITGNASGVGNWKYTYDGKGQPLKFTRTDASGAVAQTVDITDRQVVNKVGATTYTTDYGISLWSGIQSSEDITLTNSSGTYPHWNKYQFLLDSNRVTMVTDQDGYRVLVTYNAGGSVTRIQFTAANSGYNDKDISVVSNDGKSTPYVEKTGAWKFIHHRLLWEDGDIFSTVMVFAKYNPTEIRVQTTNQYGAVQVSRYVIVYEYGSNGRPVRASVAKGAAGSEVPESSFQYTY